MSDEATRRSIQAHLDGFIEFLDRDYDRLRAFTLRTMTDPEEAADAAQDAFLAMLTALRKYCDTRIDFILLYKTTVNSYQSRLRRRSLGPTWDRSMAESIARDPTDVYDAALDVRAAVRGLPLEQRTVIFLVDLLGYSYDDAAEELDIPAGMVKDRIARGRASLRETLHDHSPKEPRPPDMERLRAGLRRLRSDPVERERITAIAADAVSDELGAFRELSLPTVHMT